MKRNEESGEGRGKDWKRFRGLDGRRKKEEWRREKNREGKRTRGEK